MNLFLKNTISNNIFKESIGRDRYESIRVGMMESKIYTCQCCGWQGAKEIENRKHLVLQVDEFNEEKPIDSSVFLVCKSCYVINHIDMCIQHNYIQFVNSSYSQVDLVKISWSDCSRGVINNNNRQKAINDKKIILLNKGDQYYLHKIKCDSESKHLKVIFTDNFLKF